MGEPAEEFLPAEILAADWQSTRRNTGNLAKATNPPAIGAAVSIFRFNTPISRKAGPAAARPGGPTRGRCETHGGMPVVRLTGGRANSKMMLPGVRRGHSSSGQVGRAGCLLLPFDSRAGPGLVERRCVLMAATNPAAFWFFRIGNQVHGPMSATELLEKAAAGVITAQTPIRKCADGQWVPAEKVRGAFSTGRFSALTPTSASAAASASRDPAVLVGEKMEGAFARDVGAGRGWARDGGFAGCDLDTPRRQQGAGSRRGGWGCGGCEIGNSAGRNREPRLNPPHRIVLQKGVLFIRKARPHQTPAG